MKQSIKTYNHISFPNSWILAELHKVLLPRYNLYDQHKPTNNPLQSLQTIKLTNFDFPHYIITSKLKNSSRVYKRDWNNLEIETGKERLTAQFGSKASTVGESPRYMPRKPSFRNICSKLPTIRLPDQIIKQKVRIKKL